MERIISTTLLEFWQKQFGLKKEPPPHPPKKSPDSHIERLKVGSLS